MKYLIIDTETVDLIPRTKLTDEDAISLGFTSLAELPFCYQLSFLYDNGNRISTRDVVGKAPIDITAGASEVTGVMQMDIDEVTKIDENSNITIQTSPEFQEMSNILKDKDIYIIGHNLRYDIDVLKREGLDLSNHKVIDTLQLSKIVDNNLEFKRLSFLYYSKPDLVKSVRELTNSDEIKNISKMNGVSSHNSLFDVLVTKGLFEEYKDIIMDKENIDNDKILERLHELSITPFILETIPYGFNKDKVIKDMDTNSLLWLFKNDTDDMNFEYTLNEEFKSRGGLSKIISELKTYNLEKFLENPENITNPIFLSALEDEVKKREGVVTLGFGKFANTPISDIKENYLEWVSQNNSNEKVLDKIKVELERREKENNIEEAINSTSLEDFLGG